MIAGSTESAAAAAPALSSAARARTAPARGATAPRPAPAPAPTRSPVMAIVVIFVIIAAVAGGYFAYKKFMAPVPATTYIEINAVPWGMVKSVTSANGKAITINQETPLRLGVAPGQYTVVVTGPDGAEHSEQVSVTDDAPGSYTPVFEKIDVDKILQTN
jgi:ferric-dicitrate binding protein FerR (iron transport regulator)